MAGLACETRFPPQRPGEHLEVAVHYPEDPAPFGALICSPQPFLGGDMDNNVVRALTGCLVAAGLPVFRFNYRSVGGSDAVDSNVHRYDYWRRVEEEGDHRAVLEDGSEAMLRASRLFEPALVCGYSFGAFVALRTAERHAREIPLLLVAPPVTRLDFDSLRARKAPCLLVFAGEDELDHRPDRDELSRRFPEARVEVVAGADHFFLGREDSIVGGVAPFLDESGLVRSRT